MKAMYILWVLVGAFCIVYGELIYEGLVPELTMKQLSSGLMAFSGLTFVLLAKVFNDGEKNGNQDKD